MDDLSLELKLDKNGWVRSKKYTVANSRNIVTISQDEYIDKILIPTYYLGMILDVCSDHQFVARVPLFVLCALNSLFAKDFKIGKKYTIIDVSFLKHMYDFNIIGTHIPFSVKKKKCHKNSKTICLSLSGDGDYFGEIFIFTKKFLASRKNQDSICSVYSSVNRSFGDYKIMFFAEPGIYAQAKKIFRNIRKGEPLEPIERNCAHYNHLDTSNLQFYYTTLTYLQKT